MLSKAPEGWTQGKGRCCQATFEQHLFPAADDCLALICGPPAMQVCSRFIACHSHSVHACMLIELQRYVKGHCCQNTCMEPSFPAADGCLAIIGRPPAVQVRALPLCLLAGRLCIARQCLRADAAAF